ncbi:MAG: hypothetical protein K6T37_00720 [Acidothermus cellulolyticus]|nr:hypothetical protein [Acidothermus cellulolyticus]
MTTEVRCGHCGARMRADAAWCTLCYTPAAGQPVGTARRAEPVGAAANGAPGGVTTDTRPAARGALAMDVAVTAAGTVTTAPATDTAPVAAGTAAAAAAVTTAAAATAGLGTDAPPPAWPCHGCGASVPLEESSCPHCGAPFLPPVDDTRAKLSRFTSSGSKALIMILGSFGIGLLLIAGMYVLATLF